MDTGKLAAKAADKMHRPAAAAGVQLRVEITTEAGMIQGDGRSLERAVTAILDNAIKFSPDGGEVLVEAAAQGREVTVRVVDHGVGITQDVSPHIFERFFHVEKIGEHLFRGAGIGLSIEQAVIEQHGGVIEVESSPAGTVFQIRLPRVEFKD
jgi:signal transduction histidine kinase